jgi:hypothetical protein
MVNKIRQQFSEEILSHYNIEDREQGGVLLKDGSVAPLMVLSIGSVTQEGSFTNLEEITDFARELRYMDALSSRTPSKTSLSPAPFWGSEPEIIQWLANIVSWTIVGVQLEFAHAYPKLEGGRQKLLQIIVETFVQAGELHGRDTDRLFYLAGGRFVLVTQSTKIEQLKNAIHDQFRERVNSLLSEAGQTLSTAQADPAVDISISEVNPQQESIHDISQLSQRLFTKTEHDEANLIELIDANETKALRETDWVRFRIYLEKYFDLNELETLCFDLGVDYEAIGGDSKSEKCRKLIEFCQRHVIVAKLIAHCQKARPAVRWSRHSSFP